MKKTATLITTTLLTIFSLQVIAGDWPNFMGPSRNGISTETGLNLDWNSRKPRQVWKVNLKNPGYSGPCIAEGKVFIIDRAGSKDVVKALDLDNGRVLWRDSYESTGDFNYGYAKTTPTFDRGRLYTLSMKGRLNCYNARTGYRLWSMNVIQKFGGDIPRWDLAMSPLIDGNRLVLFIGGSKNLIILNKFTGKLLMRGGNSDTPGYATPVIARIHGVKQYVLFSAKRVLGVRASDGRVLWNHIWQTSYDVNAAQPLVIGDRVFITSNYGKGCMMLRVTRSWRTVQLWRNREIKAHFSSPLYYNGYIYGNSDPNHLVCMDPATGAVRWKKSGYGKGGLIIAQGRIIALGGSRGNLDVVDASPVYRFRGGLTPLGGQSWTAPVLANRKIVIRNKYAMVCLDVSR